jgi:hypothetical protein
MVVVVALFCIKLLRVLSIAVPIHSFIQYQQKGAIFRFRSFLPGGEEFFVRDTNYYYFNNGRLDLRARRRRGSKSSRFDSGPKKTNPKTTRNRRREKNPKKTTIARTKSNR